MWKKIQLKNPSAFFFLSPLIAPSKLLDLVHPVVAETAVSEQHMEEAQGKKLCKRDEGRFT